MLVTYRSRQGKHMRLQTSATQIDYFPQGTGEHRFTKRTIWHPGAESEMTTFSTVLKVEMKYQVHNYIANGAEILDFNLEEYTGSDYTPAYC